MNEDAILKLENKNKEMEKDMNELMNKLDMAQRELKDMQQQPGPKALEIYQNWEADSGVSSPVLSLSSQLDN